MNFIAADESGRPIVVDEDQKPIGTSGPNYIGADRSGKPVVRTSGVVINKSNSIRADDEGRPYVEEDGDTADTKRQLKNALAREKTAKDKIDKLEEQVEDLKGRVVLLSKSGGSGESDANTE